MRDQSIGEVETKNYKIKEGIKLQSGKKLSPINVAYETYGELNKEKTNAINVCHALSGDAHAAGKHKETGEKGWWDKIIGPGKALDTEKYYVICSNVLGGCKGTTGPSSKNPETNEPYGLDFPVITIGDMVKVQKKFITEGLGINKLLAVTGGSMGGMQALKWATEHQNHLEYCIPIATTAKSSPQQIAFNEVGRRAIMKDPNWSQGNYYSQKKEPRNGLALARMIGHITYLSDESMQKKFGRNLMNKEKPSFDLKTDFEVESYLNYKGNKFVKEFDPNTYLYLTKAIDYFDLTKGGKKELKKVFKDIDTKFLVISVSSDWLYPPYQSKEIVKALESSDQEVTYSEIKSSYGHDAFLLEKGQLKHIISSYLSKITVNDLAETNPPLIQKNASIKKAAKKMASTEQTHLPVVDNENKLKGIITAWDISKAIAKEQRTLEQVMTKEVITATKEESITEVTEKFRQKNISALPIVNKENEVEGLITSDQISQLIGKNKVI